MEDVTPCDDINLAQFISPTKTKGYYAVKSLPRRTPAPGEAGCSRSQVSDQAVLLDCIRQLLIDISDTPMLGVSPSEFQEQLDILSQADMAAVAANQQRSIAIDNFLQWAANSKRRVCSSRLLDARLTLIEYLLTDIIDCYVAVWFWIARCTRAECPSSFFVLKSKKKKIPRNRVIWSSGQSLGPSCYEDGTLVVSLV